jgi:RNA polymerase sigma-70 factor (ECF subfamily)
MTDPAPHTLDQDEAFATYVVPEVDVLYRVALSITRNAPDAEDLVQDTMLRAYRAIASFDGEHPRAWLLTILRNTEINRHRRRRPELLRDPDATMAREASTASTDRDPEDLVIGETFDAVVEAALAELPEKFWQVVELIDIDGLSYREAAKILDVPEGTIMSRLHRARSRIRRRLAVAGLAPRKGML